MSLATVIFILLNVLCWGSGAILDKAGVMRASANSFFFGRLLFMVIIFLPIVIWKSFSEKSIGMGMDKMSLLLAALSAIAANLGVLFYLKAMHGGEASKITPLTAAYPLIAFFLAIIILGEKFTLFKLLGTVLVCAGIAFLAV